jgi:hypothetical protein
LAAAPMAGASRPFSTFKSRCSMLGSLALAALFPDVSGRTRPDQPPAAAVH